MKLNFDIWRKKRKNYDDSDLKKAFELGLITNEEMLRLIVERAEAELKQYLFEQAKKQKK